ncbi:MAG: hypothetical protein R6X13_12330, partial [bacterium]
ATLVRMVAARLLEAAGVNRLCDRTGLGEFLCKGGVSHSPARLVALTLHWIILLAAVLWSLERIGVSGVTIWLDELLDALPAVLAAVGIGIVGYAVVLFSANVVGTLARNAAFAHADLLGRAVKWLGLIIVACVAIDHLGIQLKAIGTILQILFAAAAFGLALAFGLGCKDLARDAMLRFLRDLRERRRQPPTDLEG